MSDDIVAELDAWLALPTFPDAPMVLCQRARDEIVALREERSGWRTLHFNARAEALEQAARVCESVLAVWRGSASADRCAAAIRAVRDKPPC